MRDMGTPELTRVLEAAIESHQPPLVSGRRIKLRYAHQGGRNPPVVIIHGNQTDHVPGRLQALPGQRLSQGFRPDGYPGPSGFRARRTSSPASAIP